ncbi:MAG: hypothetical protein ABL900_17355 [Burkholderiaceae bacterium]
MNTPIVGARAMNSVLLGGGTGRSSAVFRIAAAEQHDAHALHFCLAG